MNKTKRIVSTLVLLALLCTLFAVLPAIATETDGNLLTNGVLADSDGDGTPDSWTLYGASSFVQSDNSGFAPPAGWTGNYVQVDCVTNAGLQQTVRSLKPGGLYKLSALYTSSALSPIWDFAIWYFADENDEKGTQYSKLENPAVTLTANKTAAAMDWNPSSDLLDRPFTTSETGQMSEYVFKMPEIASGTLPEGASIGLRVRVRTSNANATFKVTDIRLAETENWIVNGGFENGVAGWKITSTNAADDATMPVNDAGCNAPEGKSAVKMADSAGKMFLAQRAFLESGKTYRIRFWFKASEACSARLGVLNSDNTKYYAHFTNGGNVSGNNAATTDWRQYTYYFTPAENEASVNIRLWTWNTGGKTIYFDGIELTEVSGEGDAALYSQTNGALLSEIPAAGTEVQFRGLVKTILPSDTANVMFALYKQNGDTKQLVSLTIGGGTEANQTKHHYTDVATNFVEIKETFAIPEMPEADAEYTIQAFLWKNAEGLKPLSGAVTLLEAAE